MKQSYGIAKQVRLLEAIDKKLNVLLEAQLGQAKAAKLIAEYDVPVNPQRQRLELDTKEAVGALPLEEQVELRAREENLRAVGTAEPEKTEASEIHDQAKAMKADRRK